MNDHSQRPVKELERQAHVIHAGERAIETERPLATLLGSCVAVCLSDLALRIGGINHFMLPSISHGSNGLVDTLLAGDYAMESLVNALLARGARKSRLHAKAFGGGSIVNVSGDRAQNIGQQNVEFTRGWLQREGIPLLASDFLGPWSRKVLFLPGSGEVWCRRAPTSMTTAADLAREEANYAAKLAAKQNSAAKRIELF
ncbi:MAG: chemotaxis protein CheD [Azonexus sp.]|jgi:chemotaxis protein CheD|nr:chemotaxis protein CheD [Azonexus sp.]